MSREQQAVALARKAFETGRSKPLEYRIYQLKSLQRLFIERQKDVSDAIKKDLNKVSKAVCMYWFEYSQVWFPSCSFTLL